MNPMRSIRVAALVAATLIAGCEQPPPKYGHEWQLSLRTLNRPLWAVAPALNLSGQADIDPLLQADLVYQQLQEVNNVTVIPVNRVVEVFAALKLEKVENEKQANLVCEALGCDALVIPTVTAYDPYNPPKVGAALQLLGHGAVYHVPNADAHALDRQAAPAPATALPAQPDFIQSVGMFDAANGTTRDAVLNYAQGRNDPSGPLGPKEYFVNMDRYCGFVYHSLLADLVRQVEVRNPNGVLATAQSPGAGVRG